MNKLLKIATIADIIVNGYAFTKDGTNIKVLNLNKLEKAAFIISSAKLFVKSNGETTVENMGVLTEREAKMIREFIKDNYKEMYLKWIEKSDNGFFGEK